MFYGHEREWMRNRAIRRQTRRRPSNKPCSRPTKSMFWRMLPDGMGQFLSCNLEEAILITHALTRGQQSTSCASHDSEGVLNFVIYTITFNPVVDLSSSRLTNVQLGELNRSGRAMLPEGKESTHPLSCAGHVNYDWIRRWIYRSICQGTSFRGCKTTLLKWMALPWS